MRTMKLCVLMIGAWMLLTQSALAHQASTALLSLTVVTDEALTTQEASQEASEEASATGYLHWRLFDLEQVVGLDRDRNGELTWGEVVSQQAAIQALVRQELSLTNGSSECGLFFTGPLQFNEALMADASVVIPLAFRCETPLSTQAAFRYQGMFEVMPAHRLVWSVQNGASSQQGVLSQAGSVTLGTSTPVLSTLAEFFVQGVIHIILGPDHLAFLLTLLLVSVLVFQRGQWHAETSRAACVRASVLLISTFTLAHSLTLSAAVLGWLALPGYWVELTIAVSVVVAALNNLRPFLPGHLLMVFAFGLMHGFGFASVLQDLLGAEGTIVWSLLGFNVGVEAGQIAVALAVMPLLMMARHREWYRRKLVPITSLLLAGLGSFWVLARV